MSYSNGYDTFVESAIYVIQDVAQSSILCQPIYTGSHYGPSGHHSYEKFWITRVLYVDDIGDASLSFRKISISIKLSSTKQCADHAENSCIYHSLENNYAGGTAFAAGFMSLERRSTTS